MGPGGPVRSGPRRPGPVSPEQVGGQAASIGRKSPLRVRARTQGIKPPGSTRRPGDASTGPDYPGQPLAHRAATRRQSVYSLPSGSRRGLPTGPESSSTRVHRGYAHPVDNGVDKSYGGPLRRRYRRHEDVDSDPGGVPHGRRGVGRSLDQGAADPRSRGHLRQGPRPAGHHPAARHHRADRPGRGAQRVHPHRRRGRVARPADPDDGHRDRPGPGPRGDRRPLARGHRPAASGRPRRPLPAGRHPARRALRHRSPPARSGSAGRGAGRAAYRRQRHPAQPEVHLRHLRRRLEQPVRARGGQRGRRDAGQVLQPAVHLRRLGAGQDPPAARDRALRAPDVSRVPGPLRQQRTVHQRVHQQHPRRPGGRLPEPLPRR